MTTTEKSPAKRVKRKPAAAAAKAPPASPAKAGPPTPISKSKAPKLTEPAKAAASAKKNLSALDAAVKILAEANAALTTGEMIEQMSAKRYWTSPGGKTPAATLYSAILRELKAKGTAARFAKMERGKFALKK